MTYDIFAVDLESQDLRAKILKNMIDKRRYHYNPNIVNISSALLLNVERATEMSIVFE